MSNSWIMEYVNSTDGHVQAGEFVMIPEDSRTDGWDINDSSVSTTYEEADLSGLVAPGCTALLGFALILTTSANDRMVFLTRGSGQTVTNNVPPRVLWPAAEQGASDLYFGGPIIIYAPAGVFEYREYSASYPVDNLGFNLWGYWTK